MSKAAKVTGSDGEASLDALIQQFDDEASHIWIPAAVALGSRAMQDKDARDFLRGRLSSEQQEIFNRRRVLGAVAAMASHGLEHFHDREFDFAHELCAKVRKILRGLCEGYVRAKATLQDLELWPAWRALFEEARAKRLNQLRDTIARLSDKPQAVESNREKLARLEVLSGQALVSEAGLSSGWSLPPEERASQEVPGEQDGKKKRDLGEWDVASYMAGVSRPEGFLGLPVDLVTRALLHAGRDFGLVRNLPRALLQMQAGLDADLAARIQGIRFDAFEETWFDRPQDLVDYTADLRELRPAMDFLGLWTRNLDPACRTKFREILRQPRAAEIHAFALFLLERLPKEDSHWQGASVSARCEAATFIFLLMPARRAEKAIRKPFSGQSWPDLEQRLSLCRRALVHVRESRKIVLPFFVRSLVTLLHEQMEPAKGDTAVKIAEWQLHLVQPLLCQWNLPGTIRKDLATVVARGLTIVFHGARQRFVGLLYTVLYTLPERGILQKVVERCPDADVSGVFHSLQSVLGGLERTSASKDCQGRGQAGPQGDDSSVPAATESPKSGARTLLVRYDRYLDHLESTLGSPVGDRLLKALRELEPLLCPLGFAERVTPEQEANLRVLFSVRQRAQRLAAEIGRSPAGVLELGQDEFGELELRVETDAEADAECLSELLHGLWGVEKDCASGGDSPQPLQVLRTWRELAARLGALRRACLDCLPYPEREVVNRCLSERLAAIEACRDTVIAVYGDEDEKEARAVLEDSTRTAAAPASKAREGGGQIAARGLVASVPPAASEQAQPPEEVAPPINLRNLFLTPLMQTWMLRRHMVRELSEVHRLHLLRRLTSCRFVLTWIAAPFLAAGLLSSLWVGRADLAGLPFAAVILLNLLVMILVLRQSTGILPKGQLFMPQVTGALILGILQVGNSSPSWNITLQMNPWVRLIVAALYAGGAYFFTRELLLGSQLRGHPERKYRRTLAVMAFGLWQSFALVSLFMVMAGSVMSGRPSFAPSELAPLDAAFARWLPYEVALGPGFFQRATVPGAFRIFPWVILTWTLQVYFFTAIVERVLKGSKD